jgi:hypothetical protein
MSFQVCEAGEYVLVGRDLKLQRQDTIILFSQRDVSTKAEKWSADGVIANSNDEVWCSGPNKLNHRTPSKSDPHKHDLKEYAKRRATQVLQNALYNRPQS